MIFPDIKDHKNRFRHIDRPTRYEVNVKIKANTFGNNIGFNLDTLDVSLSGILANTHRSIVPFQKNTILEIQVDYECQTLQKPILCIGKVMRVDNVTNPDKTITKTIGIEITDIDGPNFNLWYDFLLFLEDNQFKKIGS